MDEISPIKFFKYYQKTSISKLLILEIQEILNFIILLILLIYHIVF